jgi:ankyrin repeat protein
LLTTFYISSALSNGAIGEFWDTRTDEEIVRKVFRMAERYKIAINVNQIPDVYKDSSPAPALICAVRKNNMGLVKLLIENGADISLFDEKKRSAIDYAREQQPKMLKDAKMLLGKEGIVEQLKDALDKYDKNKVESILNHLHDKYSDLCCSSTFHKKFIDFRVSASPLERFSRDFEVLKKYIQERTTMISYLQFNLFINFINKNDPENLEKAIQEQKIEDLGSLHLNEKNILEYAIEKPNVNPEIIKILLRQINPHQKWTMNITPYSLAKKKGREEIINLFPKPVYQMSFFKEKIQQLSDLEDWKLVQQAEDSYFITKDEDFNLYVEAAINRRINLGEQSWAIKTIIGFTSKPECSEIIKKLEDALSSNKKRNFKNS